MKNKQFWNIKNLNDEETEVEVKIYGEIVNVPCWEGDVSANSFKKELDKYPNAKNIVLRINSPGGDVFEAQAIYNILKNHEAEVEVRIDALAASAATIVAMAGDRVIMPNNSLFMIHNPWTYGAGEEKDFIKKAELLATIKETLLNVYQSKSTLDREEIANLMNEESWLTAEEAKEKGFVDELIDLKIETESAEEVQNFLRSPVMDSFNKVPTGKFKNLFKNTSDYNTIKNKPKEEKIVNLEQLKKDYPDLYNQIKNETKAGVEASERERVMEILNLTRPGAEEIIKNAIKNGQSKGDVAFEILNNESLQTRVKATKKQEDLEKEAEEIEEIITEVPEKDEDKELDEIVNKAIQSANNKL